MTTINLSSYVVRTDDGSIDHDATVAKFSGELVRYAAECETEAAAIGVHVNAVFDQYRGANLNMPALTSMTLTRLNCQPEAFKVLTEKVQGYIRDRAGEGGAFTISKGKGGGVRRVADLPAAK